MCPITEIQRLDNADSRLEVILVQVGLDREQLVSVVADATLRFEHFGGLMVAQVVEGLLNDEHHLAVLLGILHRHVD